MNTTENQMTESFADLFEQSIKDEKREGSVVKGLVIKTTDTEIFVDVGLKSEGRILAKEFEDENGVVTVSVGDEVEVYIERLEDRHGNTVLSRDKALREEAWYKFEELLKQNSTVEGRIIGRVKGGFAVDIGRIIAFLPGSQVDIRPVKDISPLIEVAQPFKILKMDRVQGNVVVSRRAILEESRAEARDELLSNIAEGSTLDGTVKNITDYGAFIDLGAIDGLLHITDISWEKISHPSEKLSLGDTIKVIVIKYNEETKRVSLGLKQLEENPWDSLVDKYKTDMEVEGTVTTVTDYGAFVELEPSVEGLIYHTELSWNSKNIHPRKLVKAGDKVKVKILEVDISKHKISLSMKQCQENPWATFTQTHPIGTEVEGTVENVADFGVFIKMGEDANAIEALIPAMELSWEAKPEEELKKYKKGDVVKGLVLATDVEKERITVGVKQLTEDSFADAIKEYNTGDVVTAQVVNIRKDGIEVEISEGVKTFIRKNDLSRHKSEQRPDRFGEGDKIDAKIINVDAKERKLTLSIKAYEDAEEKKAIEEYGSKDSGASLGDILGVALNNKD